MVAGALENIRALSATDPLLRLASFFASSVALRERIGGLDVTGGGSPGWVGLSLAYPAVIAAPAAAFVLPLARRGRKG